jgi:C-terminal peptidase prc
MRKVGVRFGCLLVAFLVLGLSWARAAEGQPYVVLIGVGAYKDQAIKPRPHADADAKALYDLLSNSKYLKCPADHMRLLTSDAETERTRDAKAATRENIIQALHWAASSAGEDDLILLVWVGQGAPLSDRTCYFAADSTLQNRAKDAVSAVEIQHEFSSIKSTKLCVLLDVNFRGYDAGKEKISELGLDKAFLEYSGSKDDDEDEEGHAKPVMLLSANDGLKPSYDLNKQGLFTTLVLEALQGKADADGGEPDGLVTVDELFQYVRKELAYRASALGKKEQTPTVIRRGGHFVLTHNPAIAGEVQARLEKLEAMVKGGQIGAEAGKEGRELLSAMPRRDALRKLRKAYQEFADGKLSADDLESQRRKSRLALEISRTDAEAFTDKVIEVIDIVTKHYVKPVKEPELVASAIRALYRAADEKLPREMAERLDNIKNCDEEGLRKLLMEARQKLGTVDELQGAKAAAAALQRMLHSLDPYSSYFDPDEMEEFRRSTQQDFIGVGISIQKDVVRDMVRVTSPLRDSSAYKAGIQAGDLITKVTNLVDRDGRKLATPEVFSTKGLSTSDIVKRIIGPEGSKVLLTVEREMANGPKELEFELTRTHVRVETVLGSKRKEDHTWDFYIDPAEKIAYIRVTQFAQNTESDLKRAMRLLDRQGLNGLVLDLRFDPGGYLDTAIHISDLFIDDGLIVRVQPRDAPAREHKGHHENSMLNFPLVVLVNGFSASASEILSACIQDHERGIVMGERSFGKGSVQNIMELSSGDGLKLTTASFWRPSGRNLHRFPNSKETDDWGVIPHAAYTLKLTPTERSELLTHLRQQEAIPRKDAPKKEEAAAFTDRQLEMALEYLRKQVAAKAALKKAG